MVAYANCLNSDDCEIDDCIVDDGCITEESSYLTVALVSWLISS